MNGSAAKSARRGIRRAVNGEAVDLLERHEIVLERHDMMLTHVNDGLTQHGDWIRTTDRHLTHHLTGLSRWQRLRWVLKL